jgi:L-aminopeptidase/D-esterase-like protein
MYRTLFFPLFSLCAPPASAQPCALARLEQSPRHLEWTTADAGDERTLHAFVAWPERHADALAVIVIYENRGLTDWMRSFADLQRLAVQTHSSMARAIGPFQTRNDGDVLFGGSTGEVENPELHFDDLAVVAGELAWDAVPASSDPR